MNIGVIVYSKTGHTYSVVNKLSEKLLNSGHSVKIEKLEPIGDVHPGIKSVEFKNAPDITGYDVVIFGSPVWAFSLSSVFKIYLKSISSLENKKVICFVTMAFPFAWMGGKNAISQMNKICKSKGMAPQLTSVINWTKNKEEKIDKFINNTIQILK